MKKCGTGAIIEMLRLHPGIAAPPYHRVENKFFAHDELFSLGLDYYRVRINLCMLNKSL